MEPMRIRISVFIITALLTTAAVAQSASENGAALTLAEALSKAQRQAPALQGADAAIRAADANIQLSGLRPNPTLSVEAENVMGSGRYSGFGGGEKTVSLSMPLELGGKRQARVGVAQAERTAAGVGVRTAQADLALQVTEAFVSLAAAERRAQIARTNHELAERAFHAARERVLAGKASPIEEQRADVLRINAEVRFGKAMRAVELSQSHMVRLTGVTKPFAIVSPWFEQVERVEPTAALGEGLAIMVAEAEVAAAAARIAAARSDRIPDLTLTAGMRRYGESSDKAAVLGLSIPFPLFNPGTAVVARTRAEYDRAVAARRAARLEFEQSMEQAYVDVADAVSAARAANGPALAAAEEAARIARLGYREGKFPQLELIEAERSLAETREASVDALVEVRRNLGEAVNRGDVLAVIESRDIAQLRAEIEIAKRQFELGQATFKREERLFGEKVTSRQEFEVARTSAQEAGTRLRLAEQQLAAAGGAGGGQLNRLMLRSPIKGNVTARQIALGDIVEPNTHLFEVANLNNLSVELSLSPDDAARVAVGAGKPPWP